MVCLNPIRQPLSLFSKRFLFLSEIPFGDPVKQIALNFSWIEHIIEGQFKIAYTNKYGAVIEQQANDPLASKFNTLNIFQWSCLTFFAAKRPAVQIGAGPTREQSGVTVFATVTPRSSPGGAVAGRAVRDGGRAAAA